MVKPEGQDTLKYLIHLSQTALVEHNDDMALYSVEMQ